MERSRDIWDRMESPEIDPHLYSQLVSNKVTMVIQFIKNDIFKNGTGNFPGSSVVRTQCFEIFCKPK